MERDNIIKIILGMLAFVFLMIIFVVIIGLSGLKNSEESQPVQSTQNVVNNYYTENYYSSQKAPYGYPYISGDYVVYNIDGKKYVVYNKDLVDYTNLNKNYRYYDGYSSYGKHTKEKEGTLGYVDEYSVYVKNRDNVGKFFKVTFYFEDSTKYEDSQLMIKYIRPGETGKFVYKDRHLEKYHYSSWTYEISSQDDNFGE